MWWGNALIQAHNKWVEGLIKGGALAVLLFCQLGLMFGFAWVAEGWLRLVAIVLGVGSFAISMWLRKIVGSGVAIVSLLDVIKDANQSISDISRDVDIRTGGLTGEVGDEFNVFIAKFRKILEHHQMHNLKVGLVAAESRKLAIAARTHASKQESVSELNFQASQMTAKSLEELSSRSNTIAQVNSQNLQIAKDSLGEMQDVLQDINDVATLMRDFSGSVSRLESTSEKIRELLGTVQAFAGQTNMLALNAAIEAARAGEHGRGFAVVADEVRDLAGKVRGAADQINDLVSEMSGAVAQTAEGTQGMIVSAEKAHETISVSTQKFGRMVKDFETTHDDLVRVSSAVENISISNQESAQRSTEIRELGKGIHRDMDTVFEHAELMRSTTNVALRGLVRLRLGQGSLEYNMDVLTERKEIIEDRLTAILKSGVNIWDRNYKKIPNGDFPKFDVSWNRAVTDSLQKIIDSWENVGGILYCLPISEDGYVSVNRTSISHPPTGDIKIDRAKSRHMYFAVTDPTDLKVVNSITDFSLSTFLLPDGSVVFSVYTPLTVEGKRWGTLNSGLLPSAFNIDLSKK